MARTALLVIAAHLACGSPHPLARGAATAPRNEPSGAEASSAAGGSGVRIRFQGDPNRPDFGTVVVTGLDERSLAALASRTADAAGWNAVLTVHTGAPPPDPAIPPVLGTTSIDAEGIRFTPRFPLATGLLFHARFDKALFDSLAGATGAAHPPGELVFSMPDPRAGAPVRVEAVYPSAEIVPENLLRAYVRFSAPMRAQAVTGMVQLLDERGRPVASTFVEVPGGLWDRDHRRLTLLFHPGRIKRGVGPHETMGPPLREGKRYTLLVKAGLLDARGLPMEEEFRRGYTAGAADRTTPDPASWRLTPPAGPRSPVILDLTEPMDQALMLRLVSVQDERGVFVRGEAVLSSGETRWTFTPEEPWRPGRQTIVIDPVLEDLAGNTPYRLFDEATAPEPGPLGAGAGAGGGAKAREPILLHFLASRGPRTAASPG